MGAKKKLEFTEIQTFFVFEMVKDVIIKSCETNKVSVEETRKLLAAVSESIYQAFLIMKISGTEGHTLKKTATQAFNTIYHLYIDEWTVPPKKRLIKALKQLQKNYESGDKGAKTSGSNKPMGDSQSHLEDKNAGSEER